MHLLRKVVNPELFAVYLGEKREAETANRSSSDYRERTKLIHLTEGA
ncbi:hypothetical protein L8C07_25960 [Paenibacillus sp. CMAA1739]|nr:MULTISPECIES: hypothetical protein [Paenibacillus]MDP1513408.1 hypothetical protein [Paenibacillus ottowii]MEC4569394.1 hypothetical protein [Paenibacillus sp. CMAA1739]